MHNRGRFQKGIIPWNKGMKGLDIGGKETQFKKGRNPHNYKPLGSERVADGYVLIKTSEKTNHIILRIGNNSISITEERRGHNQWREKHVLIWEAANGPRPAGHAIIFGDGDKRNFELDNLILVSRAQLSVLNHLGLIYNNAELTRTGLIIADIHTKRHELRKRKKVV